MSTKHTPGPWIYTRFCKPDGAPIETVDDVANVTAGSARYSDRAELYGVALDDADENGLSTVVCYTGNGPNSHNNARLIAAAPKLLEALEELADLFDEYQNGAYIPDSFTTQPARAAIREAKGEET